MSTTPNMRMKFLRLDPWSVCFLAALCTADVAVANWPQWRGPDGTGVAVDASPVLKWGPNENVRWKTTIPGRGHSTPIVWQQHVFLTTAISTGEKIPPRVSDRPGAHDNLPVDSAHRYAVIAIDRATGSVRWNKTVYQSVPREGGHYTASLASASAVTDGRFVYAHFGSAGLYCLDFDGNVIWQKQFGQMHTKHGHGEGSSPALVNQTLIVNWDHEEQSFLTALDTQTGQQRWRRERNEVTSWSTPLIVEVDGVAQAIVCGTDRVRGYNVQTGDVIWECGGMSANIVATPVAADGMVFVGSSYDKRAMFGIRLGGAQGDITSTDHVVWSRSRGTPYVPSPLLYDGGLYFLAHYQNVLTRVRAATGADDPGAMRLGPLGNIYASPVGAAGHVFITDLDGNTLVLTNTAIPRMVALNRLGEPVSASLAIVKDQVFIRGDKHLFCIAQDD